MQFIGMPMQRPLYSRGTHIEQLIVSRKTDIVDEAVKYLGRKLILRGQTDRREG